MPRVRSGFRILAALIAATGLAEPLMAASPSSSDLDNAEARVCGANVALKNAAAATERDKNQSFPMDGIAHGATDPARRAFLQREMDSRVRAAQQSIADSARSDLLRSQSDYRLLTGREFDTGLCDGGRVRVTHAMLDQDRREAEQAAFSVKMKQVLAQGEAYRQAEAQRSDACSAKLALELDAKRAAMLFPPGYQEKSRQVYDDYLRAYQREHGKPFDPVSGCRR